MFLIQNLDEYLLKKEKTQSGYFTIEILIAATLSSMILMSIFSSYLLIKDQYLKQTIIANEQDNIQTLYLFLKKLIEKSDAMKIYTLKELHENLRVLSDVLEVTSKNQVYKLYLRKTKREKIKSLYLKINDFHAQEFIPDVSSFEVEFVDKYLQIKIKQKSKEIPIYIQLKDYAN